ncbi:clathrin heavy chain 2-like [Liolophura sinensis]|uniref:clathrin heavy chain 2-like n=1 Tax=Liolophura sinensis TaxID=3198878 RepID=UPI0031592B3D
MNFESPFPVEFGDGGMEKLRLGDPVEGNREKTSPVTISELIQLSHIGVSPDQVTWSRVTMTSDRWICIRHDNKEDACNNKKATVTVLNPRDGVISFAGTTTADSVQMNPYQPIIALKAGLRFEVFNLETKVLISQTKMVDSVIYWTWLNSDVVSMVTETAVYHWDLWQGDSPPDRVFTRHSRLAFSEIVSYKSDPSLKWLALTGLIPEHDRISGLTQLYNVEEDITQCISSHSVTFSQYHFMENVLSSTVMCVASRDLQDHGKTYVIELGPYKQGNFAPRSSYDHIQYYDDTDRYDFPVSIQVSTEYGLFYVVTKYGYMYVCDMETAACLCISRVSHCVVFCLALNSKTQGIIGVNRDGQVLTVNIKKDGFLTCVRETGRKKSQAKRLEKAMTNHSKDREGPS